MEPWMWAVVFKPLVAMFIFALPIPIVMAIRRWWPDGRVKRFLLSPIPDWRKRAAK